ncbi:conserved hypothetical protein [Methanococcus vannielii SB]|uniref:DUF4013 domain-containing protein n=1 Tax=Methanococcus vannielii (strain ATCC 35089 / DSM 1224 / JCM 13029 / OCM 148 / SB) TaxID=406327 RepID=A6UR07_METVS|nr:DUF4013 domain-containing protein [Methanococcus vannielii]ABR54929.1 conserved hypothetical protein [Methanococcus vannielii SB]
MDFKPAFRFPLSDDNAFKKMIIGSILSIIPVLNLISLGYAIETLENILNSKDELPNWDFLGRKFIKGLFTMVIYFIYMLIPFMIIFFLGGSSIYAIFSGIESLFMGGIFGFLFTVLLVLFTTLIIGFIVPMAILNYTASGEFFSAFHFFEIINKISLKVSDYILMYLLLILLSIGLRFIAIIPIIGLIIIMVMNFYFSLVFAYILGKIYLK